MLITEDRRILLEMTTTIVSAAVANDSYANDVVVDLIGQTYAMLNKLANGEHAAAPEPVIEPAVSIRKSLSNPAHIISLIDGKPYKMLRRHLANHGHTPESYRKLYGLPDTYPMVAPGYSEVRRQLAKDIGLGKISQPKRGRKAAA